MRLINVKTLELEEFFDENIPKYAILSHTWGHEEVSFQDLCWLHDYDKKRLGRTSLLALVSRTGRRLAERALDIRQREGFEKIVQSAYLARKRNLKYVWVDTCCIDKSSSAELSEAINSMFRWYENSVVCFAFLSDVRSQAHTQVNFQSSRWFTRGWTLQELIAPRTLRFYDKYWVFIGSREDNSDIIYFRTGIPIEKLESKQLNDFAIAVRLGWARNRETSRKEDLAYCLMGICSINMPLLYGEGDKAFLRLQQEIIKEHRGQSVFAWGYDESLWIRSAFFAPSPSYFGNLEIVDKWTYSGPFLLNNKGLEISLRIFPLPEGVGRRDIHFAVWDVAAKPRFASMHSFSSTHLCTPLLASSTDGNGIEDGQEMVQTPSRPVLVNTKYLPKATARHRVLVLEPQRLDSSSDYLKVRILLRDIPQFLRLAKLVEVFPPAADIHIANTEVTLYIGEHHGYGTHILRFLVPNKASGTVAQTKEPIHFAMIISPYSPKAGLEEKPGPEVTLCRIGWMDHSKSSYPRKGEEWRTRKYWSLVDAFLAGVPLLDANMWIDKQAPFFVSGRPVLAATTLKSEGNLWNTRHLQTTEISLSLGSSNSQVDNNDD